VKSGSWEERKRLNLSFDLELSLAKRQLVKDGLGVWLK
jgi:hypothetical protein